MIRPRSPHHQQRQHRTAVEYPGGEGEEVDERVDAAGQDHGAGDERVEDQARGRGEASHVHVAQAVHEVALTRGGEAQTARGEQGAVGRAEGRHGDGERHEPGHHAEDTVAESLLRDDERERERD
ncbi:hypothetical protein TKK_0003675 [Trichogramma kaykai]